MLFFSFFFNSSSDGDGPPAATTVAVRGDDWSSEGEWEDPPSRGADDEAGGWHMRRGWKGESSICSLFPVYYNDDAYATRNCVSSSRGESEAEAEGDTVTLVGMVVTG